MSLLRTMRRSIERKKEKALRQHLRNRQGFKLEALVMGDGLIL
jgi:hypothetical protein